MKQRGLVIAALVVGIFIGYSRSALASPDIADSIIDGISVEDCRSLESIVSNMRNRWKNDIDEQVEHIRATIRAENIYRKNCPDRPVQENLPERTCEAIEVQMQVRIVPESLIIDMYGNDSAPYVLMDNAETYTTLIRLGCPENADRFRALAVRQMEIASALLGEINEGQLRNNNVGSHVRLMRIYESLKEDSEFQREARRVIERASRFGIEVAQDFISRIERIRAE